MEPFSKKAREATREVVLDLHKMFVGMVAKRRKLSEDQARVLADGRVFTGRQALKNGLLDALGGETEARQWLAKSRKIAKSLPVKDVGVQPVDISWTDLIEGIIGKIVFSERLRLDGPISVWHPDLWS